MLSGILPHVLTGPLIGLKFFSANSGLGTESSTPHFVVLRWEQISNHMKQGINHHVGQIKFAALHKMQLLICAQQKVVHDLMGHPVLHTLLMPAIT